MASQPLLILAVARMPTGFCLAGMSAEPDPVTGLRWVRPVRERGPVLLGDITTPGGEILRPFDVVEFNLLQPRPVPPFSEDWLADFGQQRPRLIRRLAGERRASFLRQHLDAAPRQVLDSQQRSLCLIKPDWVKGSFRLNKYSGGFDAHLAFGLAGRPYLGSYARGGLPVGDLRWRAMGRAWLPPHGGWTEFEARDLEARLGIQEVYLAVSLAPSCQGGFQPTIVGIHTLPDYEASVDYDNL